MSATIYRGQVLTKDDLNIFIRNEQSELFDPFSITYTIYKMRICFEDMLVETMDTIPITFGIGKYFAAWKQPKDTTIGKYKIKWNIKKYFDTPFFEVVEDFDIIERIDPLVYSSINSQPTQLPHKLYGNNNVCAG